jgi:hypothetical protein
MSIVLQALLPKLHINRNTVRAIIHGPEDYGGIRLPHLYTYQCFQKITLFLGHMRLQDKTGKLLVIGLSNLQLLSGSGMFVLNLPYTISETWIEHKSRYYISDICWQPKKQRENDSFLMEFFLTITRNISILKALNHCRVYLQVLLVSDIATANGCQLLPEVKLGYVPNQKSSLKWPIQGRPSLSDWNIWSHHLAFLESGNRLTKPLGKWISNPHQEWETYYHPLTRMAYKLTKKQWTVITPISHSLGSSTFDFNTAREIEDPPSHLSPATFIKIGQSSKFTVKHGGPYPQPVHTAFPQIFDNPTLRHIVGPYPPTYLRIASNGSYFWGNGGLGHSWLFATRAGRIICSGPGAPFGNKMSRLRSKLLGILSTLYILYQAEVTHPIK